MYSQLQVYYWKTYLKYYKTLAPQIILALLAVKPKPERKTYVYRVVHVQNLQQRSRLQTRQLGQEEIPLLLGKSTIY